MKIKKGTAFFFISMLILILGCSPNEPTKNKLVSAEGVPEFVKESDFKKVDWDKKAVKFDGDIIGNKNKSGVIGVDAPSIDVDQKWMWHLWGIENSRKSKLTVIGFHKETGTTHQVLTSGWTINLEEGNNGADAHAPSSVNIPETGDWAFLLYVDKKLFDTLVYEINE